MTKHVYISAYEAAPIIGISRQAISKMVQRGTFIKGYMVMDKRLGKRVVRYRLRNVEVFAKIRRLRNDVNELKKTIKSRLD